MIRTVQSWVQVLMMAEGMRRADKAGKFTGGVKWFGLANKGVDYAFDQYNAKILTEPVRKRADMLRQSAAHRMIVEGFRGETGILQSQREIKHGDAVHPQSVEQQHRLTPRLRAQFAPPGAPTGDTSLSPMANGNNAKNRKPSV